MATRRNFLQALGAFLVARRLPAMRKLWTAPELGAPSLAFRNFMGAGDDIVDVKNVVIGAWADYWPPPAELLKREVKKCLQQSKTR